MTKKYTLTTSEETVTENPEDIIRLMKLAGLTNAQPVAEEEVTEEVEAEVYEPTEANDKLDLDDYSKKSPESINKQKKSIQPTLGDNPLEYSLDENEIYDAMMEEFKESEELNEVGRTIEKEKERLASLEKQQVKMKDDKMEVARLQALIDQAKKNIANNMNESEEITEKQSPAQKAAFAKMLAAKNGKKDDTVEETEETEKTVEENLKKAEEQINELKEDCGCGHGSDCDCGPECDCGCNAVNEERVDEIVPLIIGGLARAAIGSVAKKAIGGVAKAAVGAVGNAASNSGVNASKKSKGKKLNAVKNEETVKEDKSMTDGTIKKLQYLVDTNHDVYEEMGDIFGMFGSPYTADEWLSHMKLTIDEVFTKEGSPIPPEVAKVYNDLEAYSKQTELQAKRRANTEISSPNDAIYGPENEDEVYIRDNFAEQWYDAFYKVEGRLGLEQDEDFDESSDMDRLKKLSGVERESQINEDESVWNQFKELHDKMDPESEDRIFFSMKNYPKHRFEIHGDIDGKDTKSGNVNVGVFLDQQTDNGDDFLQNMSISQDEIKANITGAGWVGSDPAKGELKGTAGDYKEFGDVKPETSDADQDRLAKLSGINASKKYY